MRLLQAELFGFHSNKNYEFDLMFLIPVDITSALLALIFDRYHPFLKKKICIRSKVNLIGV